jgi:plastocyanin
LSKIDGFYKATTIIFVYIYKRDKKIWNLVSHPTSSHAYGIGLIAVIVGAAIGVSYYQLYFIPELNARPIIPDKILHPGETTTIIIVPGAENPQQDQNYLPHKIEAQLGVNNLVIWKNTSSEAAHTVTPDKPFKDIYSEDFGSPGIIKPGMRYQFLFTQEAKITYHCDPHPWMHGEIDVVRGALTS